MLDSIFEGIKSFLGDTLSSVFEAVLNATIFKLLYYAEKGLCWIIAQLYDMFEVFAGIVRVKYDGEYSYLIDVFFHNTAVNNIYWAMALIGIALTFGFAIWAVARKMFDLDGKQQQSLGQIIGAGMKSIFLIISMTLVISVVLRMTNTLMEQIDEMFNNAWYLNISQERDFTEDEYAAMGRVLANIGNASMVPNNTNRYNVNLCFNEIRGDMLYLQQQGVFQYSYYQKDQNGNEIKSWQSVLSQIARSTDLRYDVKIDVYNQGVMTSMKAAMDYLQSGGTIAPVSHVSGTLKSDGKAHLDNMVFLMGTLRAARNSAYNENPSLTDALRAPYFYEQGRSIYDFDNVDDDFNIGFPTDYILVFMAAFAIIMDLITIILNCVARIFNMLFLYIIAPPIIAAGPLDGGGKFKQWTTAFLVQSLSVFGTVISMRLLLLYLPIVISPQLVLFENRPLLNVLSKFVLIFGGFEAAKKSTSLLTGILADSAGWQAIQAGDMSSSAGKLIGGAAGVAKGAAGLALKTAGGAANFATKPVQNLGARAWAATGGKWTELGKPSENKMGAGGGGGGSVGGGGEGGGSAALPTNSTSSSAATTAQGNKEHTGGIGARPTLGPKPKTPPPRSKEAPASSGRRLTLEQMERKADFRAATTSKHTGVGGSATPGGSFTAESGGSRMSLNDNGTPPPKAGGGAVPPTGPKAPPRRPSEAPLPSNKRPSLDD